MARSLALKPNTETPDSDYPFGRIRDRSGATNGTGVNENVYGDIHQFFAKLFSESGLTYNELPDNDYSGFQLYEALLEVINAASTEWATVGGLGQPAFQNSWNFNTNPVKFKKDNSGFVCIEGICSGGTSGTTVFTLPAGFRPSNSKRFRGSSNSLSSGEEQYLSVDTSGNVYVNYSDSGTPVIFLDAIRFAID